MSEDNIKCLILFRLSYFRILPVVST